MIDVLVVDDDFRVAQVHASYVGGVEGFRVVGAASTAAQALEQAAVLRPQLVLLDNYLPDRPGVEIVAELGCDVMMVTADSSAATVRAALRAGALNYVIKPFSADLLAGRLRAYARFAQLLDPRAGEVSQQGVDRAVQTLHQADRPPTPKGQSPVTARLIVAELRRAAEPLTAADIADRLGIARGTAQRYLAGLADEGRVQMSLRYGSTGRPEHQYLWTGSRRP